MGHRCILVQVHGTLRPVESRSLISYDRCLHEALMSSCLGLLRLMIMCRMVAPYLALHSTRGRVTDEIHSVKIQVSYSVAPFEWFLAHQVQWCTLSWSSLISDIFVPPYPQWALLWAVRYPRSISLTMVRSFQKTTRSAWHMVLQSIFIWSGAQPWDWSFRFCVLLNLCVSFVRIIYTCLINMIIDYSLMIHCMYENWSQHTYS